MVILHFSKLADATLSEAEFEQIPAAGSQHIVEKSVLKNGSCILQLQAEDTCEPPMVYLMGVHILCLCEYIL